MTGNFSFGGVALKDVVGYRISANWTPNLGFQGYFYVYVWDMQNPQDPFDKSVNVGDAGAPARGDLTIEDGLRTYTFKNIDLLSAQVGATRRYRYRLLEFRYVPAIINAANKPTPIQLQNSSPERVALGGLNDAYQYALDQGAENLLGFRYRPAAAGSNVVRFSSLRNNQNCFLQKMIAANDQKNQNQAMTQFTVTFSQGNFDIKQQNLLSWYIDESYGYMLGEDQPPLSTLVQGNANVLQAVTAQMDDFTQRELLKFDVQQDPVDREADPRTVETSTFVFVQGNYQNLNIT